METKAAVEGLVKWIQERVREAGARGIVVGLSGGIDSAVTAALAARACPGETLGVIMPCHSDPQDAEDARLVARHLQLPTAVVDLTPVYDALVTALGENPGQAAPRDLARANLKPRLRMATLYFFANRRNYLVAGTGNRSELTVGYFTKYGDGGVDILPLGGLVKQQVRLLAYYLDIPREIIARRPSAGLWEGQTDEGEMGLTYEELDHFLLTRQGRPEVVERVTRLSLASEHKRRLPAVPDPVLAPDPE
ncbi:MAG: NAD(+) synthase [Bacillota bacterium]|nr:NAD(+) synthase [Bacillota bacterium]